MMNALTASVITLLIASQGATALECGQTKRRVVAGAAATTAASAGALLYELKTAEQIVKQHSRELYSAPAGAAMHISQPSLPTLDRGDRLTATVALSEEESRAVYLAEMRAAATSPFDPLAFGAFGTTDTRTLAEIEAAVADGSFVAPQLYMSSTKEVFTLADTQEWLKSLEAENRTITKLTLLPIEQVNLLHTAKAFSVTAGILATGALAFAVEEAVAGKVSAQLEQRLLNHACQAEEEI